MKITKMLVKCTKSVIAQEVGYIVMMKGDILEFVGTDDNCVDLIGVEGYSQGIEITLPTKDFHSIKYYQTVEVKDEPKEKLG